MIDAQQHREIIARKLKMLRKSHPSWTQMQLATRLKIGKPRYASYEEARAVVPYRIIRDICRICGITIDDFEKLEILQKQKSL